MRYALAEKKLRRSLKTLQAEFNELAARHKALVLRHTIVHSWSDGIACYQVCKALADVLTTEGARGEDSSNSSEVFQQLLEQEDALLRQLPDSPASTSSSIADEVLDFGISTIAPPGYPIQSFKDLLQQAPVQHAADITMQQYVVEVRQFIMQLSFHLHRLQSHSSAEEAQEALRDVMTRFSHLHASLMMLGRKDVVAGLVTYNLDTLQSDPANLQLATQRTASLAGDLHLTTQQCLNIATGVELYLSSLQVNQQEQQSVKAELAAIHLAATSISDGSAAAGANLHAQQLEQQQQLYQRLQVLLQKEYVLQFVVSGWLAGCLSYEQLAWAIVLAWPYQLRLTHLGIGIQTWYRQQQREQREQREQQQQAHAEVQAEP